MKYRLKNRMMQAQLDRLSNGDFSRRLDEWDGVRTEELVTIQFGEPTGNGNFPRKFEVSFRTDSIEEVPPYRPDQWNEWPLVTPPEKVLLRAEILTERFDQNGPEPKGGRPRYRGCAKWIGYWDFFGDAHVSMNETVRFRPWEDKKHD